MFDFEKALYVVTKVCAFVTIFSLASCSEDELLTSTTSTSTSTLTTGTTSTTATSCGCTYTVPSNTYLVDGKALALQPGAVICLKAGNVYKNIVFRNIVGTATAPITIKNCGGTVTLDGTGRGFTLKTELSKYFRITGGSGTTHGIKILAGQQGMQLEKLSTNFEIDHLEISNSGFAGIMAKTDPTCDNTTIRGNFVMRDVSFHDNYIHHTGGEGFYVGHTFYLKGVSTSCGTRYPHTLEGVKIYNNVVKYSGWEAIQVGSSPKGVEVYNNRIENYGVKNVQYQNNGVQFGEGSPAKFYGNYIANGPGTGVIIIGNGENFAYNNIIVNAGQDGIFCDERTSTGAGFKFINNTIINPGKNGITLYTEYVPMNVVQNNIIINPGYFSKYTYPRTGNDAYIYVLSKAVKTTISNNYQTRSVADAKFINASSFNYALTSVSPAINKGVNISTYAITLDYAKLPRLKGTGYDIGAYEFQF
jgi:hypothetical protein